MCDFAVGREIDRRNTVVESRQHIGKVVGLVEHHATRPATAEFDLILRDGREAIVFEFRSIKHAELLRSKCSGVKRFPVTGNCHVQQRGKTQVPFGL